ncbi:MAG: hypothetical protein L6V93_15210 [Clostridiales bacterium]|nr:MAG: hypothetical protein L6V93_15210 [Clostridiales bacterium]
MSVASYWGLISGSVPGERLDRFVSHLENENEFNRTHRVPSLSASDENFVPTGGYWCGAVWAPATYMILKGLENCKKTRLAHEIGLNHVENVVKCFEETGTVWEKLRARHLRQKTRPRAVILSAGRDLRPLRYSLNTSSA